MRVEIASGRLRGTEDRGTVVFRGIPYARPPVHERAFRAPEPPDPWSGTRAATHFGSAAPQFVPRMRILRGLIGVPAEHQSQDCLTLNVWTPGTDAARRPVMVWIHGGAFVMGTGATFLYHGARLARRGDVVVVTINYRLGALGFLNHPELRARGIDANLGIRDQIRALEWVRANIAAFGGDPGNVTIFGESAGGMSVGTLLAAPATRGLFHRAILQSGAMHHVADEAQGARIAELFLDALGLTPQDAEAVRYARTAEIQRAQQMVAMQLGIGQALLPWQPSVDGDCLPRTALEALDRGEVARVPTLVGSNRDEWRLFTLFDPRTRRLEESDVRRRLARQLGSEREADAAIEVYRAAQRGRRSPARLWEAVQSDRVFHHPAQRAADGLSELGVPVWRYLFSWRPPVVGRRIGSGHGLELPFVFGTLRDGILRRTIGASYSARRLSRRMRDAWIAFAREGAPGHAHLPEWPAYDTRERATLEFDRESELIRAPFAAESAFWRPRLG
ncbi:MAG TPA: carboxylesterase/lipase family protein [Myxococcota bacterium]|nr:carboxylesterase/lipase family protein [Myxococcota bacterium]